MKKENTAGDLLSKARNEKDIALDDIESKIYISTDALKAIESNNFNFFSSRINAEELTKIYAKYLELDTEYIASLVRRDYVIVFPEIEYSNYDNPSRFAKRFDFWWWVGISIILASLIFFGYQIFLYILPPKLSITEPSAKSFKRLDKIRVGGVVDRGSEVRVNETRGNVGDDGNFFADVPLGRGKNEIVVKVVGDNGRQTVRVIEVMNE